MSEIHDIALNSDAVYAALVWVRDNVKVMDGTATSAEMMAYKIEGKAPAVDSRKTRIRPAPAFVVTPELLKQIYPGERSSVVVGLDVARWLVSDAGLLVALADSELSHDDPISRAIRRFIADRSWSTIPSRAQVLPQRY